MHIGWNDDALSMTYRQTQDSITTVIKSMAAPPSREASHHLICDARQFATRFDLFSSDYADWYKQKTKGSLLVILLHSMFLFYVCCRFLFMEVLWALSCQGLYGSSGKPKTGNVATGIVSVQVQRRFNHPTHGNCWQGLLRMPAHFERLNCFIFKNT